MDRTSYFGKQQSIKRQCKYHGQTGGREDLSGKLKKRDDNLGIAVLAVAKNTVSESAWNQIQIATLGSSIVFER